MRATIIYLLAWVVIGLGFLTVLDPPSTHHADQVAWLTSTWRTLI